MPHVYSHIYAHVDAHVNAEHQGQSIEKAPDFFCYEKSAAALVITTVSAATPSPTVEASTRARASTHES